MGKTLGLQLMSIMLLAGVMTKAGGSIPRPKLTGPSMAYVKTTVMFECRLPGSEPPLSYELIKDREVIDMEDDPQGGQTITFSLKVSERSGGQYYCKVRARGLTSTSNVLNLQVVTPVQGTHLVSHPDPPVIYEGAGFTFHCHVKKGTHLSYMWYHNKHEVTSHSPLYRLSGNALTVDRARERHAGYYVCMATNNIGNTSRSSSSIEVPVVVKKYLSAPKLSFTLYYHDSGYHANVSCRSDHGSPPVTFRLLLDGKNVSVKQADSLEAWFTLPVTVGMDMGSAQCRAETDIQQLLSDPVDLEVVPVGGAARVVVEYLQRADSVVAAALLQCIITRGTFPHFSWSFNHSSLPSEDHSHGFSSRGSVLVLTEINTGNSGYYRCRARDSFNSDSAWVESEEVLVKRTNFVMSIEVIAMAFCCFLLLNIVGGAFCLFWAINHKSDHDQDGGHDRDVNSCEQTNTDMVGAMLETGPDPQLEEMDTVIMEVEV